MSALNALPGFLCTGRAIHPPADDDSIGKPIPGLFWAAGFSFSRAELFTEVPYQHTLRHLFFGERRCCFYVVTNVIWSNTDSLALLAAGAGEEISYWARAWSAGWSVFAPAVPVCYHLWSRAHRPTFREHATPHTAAQEQASLRAVLAQFTPPTPASNGKCQDHWAMTKAFLEYVGLDIVGKTIMARAGSGGLSVDAFV